MGQTTEELDLARAYWRTIGIPSEKLAVMDRATAELIASGLRGTAVREGQRIEPFALKDAQGEWVRSESLLETGPLVISFYRGGWCPYCNIELRGLERILPRIRDWNGSVIAISPERPDRAASTKTKNRLSFPVVSDPGNVVAKQFGIAFTLPSELLVTYDGFGHGLAAMNGAGSASELPVPATFVVDGNGIVQLAFVEEGYMRRLDPEAILPVLERLGSTQEAGFTRPRGDF